jgi:hypothetical protein
MHVTARPSGQPCSDGCRFVGGVVVHDDVDVEVPGDLSVDLFEETKEFGGPVSLVDSPMTKPVATSSAANIEVMP